MERGAEGPGEIGVRYSRGRYAVEHWRRRFLQCEAEHFRQVAGMNPGHPLPAAAQRAAQPGTKGSEHGFQGAAARVEHDPDANPRDAYSQGFGIRGFLLPGDADIGKKTAARGGILDEHLIAAGTVVADGRSAD